ncbi:MAG: hypothetical protein AABX04_06010 [Nanoarchaeota archaeon]
MNKTELKVLQEIIRNKESNVSSLSQKLKKSPSRIYGCLQKLKPLLTNPLIESYKKLFLSQPYDFSFLTPTNLKILLKLPSTFTKLVKETKLSRFTVHQLLRQLKNRGFINQSNEIINPELLELLQTLKKYPTPLSLPVDAVIVYQDQEHDLILSETPLKLSPTAFSAFDVNIQPLHRYYTTKIKPTKQDIFEDAKLLSKDKRDQFITALFYYKHRKELKEDKEYQEIIESKEFTKN